MSIERETDESRDLHHLSLASFGCSGGTSTHQKTSKEEEEEIVKPVTAREKRATCNADFAMINMFLAVA